ncbi:MAG: hypothetical protein ABNH38_22015 [Tateyamaria sp.]
MRPDLATPGTRTQIDMLGQLVDAEVITPGPYDPETRLPRG